MLPGVDLVVVNYRTPDDLQGWVASLVKHPPLCDVNVWIRSNDPSPMDELIMTESLQKLAGVKSVVVAEASSGENLYYSGSCNRLANCYKSAQREVIGFFNADTRFLDGSIDRCYQALIHHDDWGVLGPFQKDDERRVTHAGIFGSPLKRKDRGFKQIDYGRYYDTLDALSVSGSAYFVKRSVWQELSECPLYRAFAPDAKGAFLPTTHYFEDEFCSLHAKAHGHRVIYYGEAKMIHRWHKSTPPGGWAERQYTPSLEMFVAAMNAHGISLHDEVLAK